MKKFKDFLIIFLKFPTEGKVKTRLAEGIGEYKAKEIYKTILEEILREIKKLQDIELLFFHPPDDNLAKIKNLIGDEFKYYPQKGNNLGEKMKNSFKKIFELGGERGIIIGTDIPDLNSEIINEAIIRLHKTDTVIGPSVDGGYYLLGMRNFYPAIFEEIKYSTNQVLQRTLVKIEELNLSLSSLITLQDIDTEEDLINWLQAKPHKKIQKKIKEIYEADKI
jgi:uncharacterized protein